MIWARLWAAARNDVRLQWRQGFYAAYVLLTALYILALRLMPARWYSLIVPVLVFTDPAVAGFFFAGALVVLERDDGMMQTLFVTPLGIGEYVAAKALSLTTIAIVTSVVIAAGAVGLGFDIFLLTIGVALTAAFVVQVGLALAVRFETINRFMLGGSAATLVLAAPLLAFFGRLDWSWSVVVPTHASLVLIGGAFADRRPGSLTVASSIAWLLACNVAAFLWAHRWIARYGAGRMGPARQT